MLSLTSILCSASVSVDLSPCVGLLPGVQPQRLLPSPSLYRSQVRRRHSGLGLRWLPASQFRWRHLHSRLLIPKHHFTFLIFILALNFAFIFFYSGFSSVFSTFKIHFSKIIFENFISLQRIFQKWLYSVLELRIEQLPESLWTKSHHTRGWLGNGPWVWTQLGIWTRPRYSGVLAERFPGWQLPHVHLLRQWLWCQQ